MPLITWQWQRYQCTGCRTVFAVMGGKLLDDMACPVCGDNPATPVIETTCEIEERLCMCNVGAGDCPIHPGQTKTKEEKIAFRKAWDARVEEQSA